MLLLLACATTVPHGHLKEDEALSSIKVGTTTQAEVTKALGSPSSQSTFGPPTWYYISSIQEQRSILPPKKLDQHVVEIAFDSSGVVTELKQYALSDSKNIEVATATTPTEGQKLGFFEQMIDNLGRFNKPTNATSNAHTHGDTGIPTGYPGR